MAHQAAQVYIVGDDGAAREAVAELVRTLGLVVYEFESTQAFFGVYDGHRPACILTDMRMLSINGNDLLLELRNRDLTIPVIVLTAQADTRSTVLVMKNGAFTTLDKACQNTELWDTVRAALHEDISRSQEDRRRHEVRQRLKQLNSAERDVLKGMIAGNASKLIALRLDMGVRTVEGRRKAIYRKMKTHSVAELVKLVMLAEPELLPPEPAE